ncbi:monocarboxylate transporter 14-like [Strongylocentrotus purpuratus]|uniref:Major facilitator superfamily (MFS) profile domain-containing protein n=1 Tax=Strongylocentrotus purpuratus TaxID=7668 RepID=A0A7M7LTU5_STRPU|nr:monocarboxylate transporter 14-like [Strongylocentrotus purpuratus]|eukprot:XP_011680324.1 PREDICTED: monocarboxylate transporter 14-like [Strongylocentrotus purpuratus]
MSQCSCSLRDLHPTWGWLVVVGAFVVNLVCIGTLKSFGVLLPYLVENLNTSTSYIGLAVGLSHGLSVGFAIVTNQLLKKINARKLIIFGGLMAGGGYCGCAVVTTIQEFMTCVIISALGYGLVILSIRVTVVRYFPANYFIAASIMLSGGGVGMMVLPLLTEFLIEVYGWRGALLLIGGLNLQTMVAGALLRPCPTDRTHESTPLTSNQSINHGPTYSRLASDNDGDENTLSPADSRQKYDPTSKNSPTRKEDLPGTSSSSYHSEELLEDQAPWGVWKNIKHGFIQMVHILDFRIFCDYPMFSLTLVAIFLHGITYTGWIVFLVPNAIAKGYSPYTAVSLAAIGGASNVVGRLSIGFFLQMTERCLTPTDAFAGALMISAIAFFMNPVANMFAVIAIAAVINGISNGSKTVLVTLVSRSSVSPERFPTALSFAMFVRGFSEPLGGLITGWMYDRTLSYNDAFLVLGALDACGFVFMVLARCFACHSKA